MLQEQWYFSDKSKPISKFLEFGSSKKLPKLKDKEVSEES